MGRTGVSAKQMADRLACPHETDFLRQNNGVALEAIEPYGGTLAEEFNRKDTNHHRHPINLDQAVNSNPTNEPPSRQRPHQSL